MSGIVLFDVEAFRVCLLFFFPQIFANLFCFVYFLCLSFSWAQTKVEEDGVRVGGKQTSNIRAEEISLMLELLSLGDFSVPHHLCGCTRSGCAGGKRNKMTRVSWSREEETCVNQ